MLQRILLGLGLSLVLATANAAGTKITKCQDARGKWYYGDTAADACARSKVTEMSEHGTTKREIAAPLTEEQLRARAANREADERKQRELAEGKRRDEILLSSYALEQDIMVVRDRKLGELEASIKASELTLKSLSGALARLEKQAAEDKDPKLAAENKKALAQTKSQIERHESAIVSKRKEQETVRAQFDSDLERYRQLKSGKAKASAQP